MNKSPEGYIEYKESDLRFTGWEHECIIIDRCENHYFVPFNRFEELLEINPKLIENPKISKQIYHHPFCNYFASPRYDCKLCESLYNLYPLKENELPDSNCADRIMSEFFPNVVKIK